MPATLPVAPVPDPPGLRRGYLGFEGCRYCSEVDAPQPVVSHTEASGPSGDAPTGLRCNWLPDPLAIRDEAPWFSWARTGAAGAGRQRSYQLLVARDAEKLRGGEADAWDSGRRGGMASGGVRYEGPPLERGVGYFWKVRIWTDGGPS
jgi:alpha-L-rhamnosidase